MKTFAVWCGAKCYSVNAESATDAARIVLSLYGAIAKKVIRA